MEKELKKLLGKLEKQKSKASKGHFINSKDYVRGYWSGEYHALDFCVKELQKLVSK